MSKLIINGGKKLFGEIEVSSAKNSFLPILAGCILSKGEVVLHKYPKYSDTESMCQILSYLGGKITRQDDCIIIQGNSIDEFNVPSELASLVRSSIFTLGAIIGRFRKAKVAYPGGCEIGARPIDIHLSGLRKLGVEITEKHGYIYCDGRNMHADKIMLDFPSVGATESLMMASVLVRGETKIFNCAKEPEVVDLQNFLNTLGAKVSGAGSGEITINGVPSLHGGVYTPIKDRIIAGTYLIACAMCGGEISLNGINPEFLQSVITKLDKTACQIEVKRDKIKIISDGRPFSLGKIETAVYPGVPTDLQAQLLALQTISNGFCMVVENLFESRFKHVPELIKMGADIHLKDRVAFVRGVPKLFGAEVYGGDLRGTASLIISGLAAEGYTTVHNIYHVDRGYENIEKQLASLGADIKRVN